MSKVESDLEDKKTKLLYSVAEKEDAELKFRKEQEKHQKLQLDYETLDRDI